ncbi:MAG: class I SAM-dependent methyltransferase [Bacteroidota bacterium]|nr:class I SAM-dependent methyltransferase [Bacteroidota bacterium]
MGKDFIDVHLSSAFIDRYLVRKSIFDALNLSMNKFSGKFLDIGCGKMPYKEYILKNTLVNEYIGLDIEGSLVYDAGVKPDFTWDGIKMPFEGNSFECAFATEVLEHCPHPEIVLKETIRVLKPGGLIFFTVPFLWPLHEVPHDEYRYTPFSLARHLKQSGFIDIEIKALGGWHASMAQMLGLWVKRSPLSPRKRKILSMILLPVVKYLIKKDKFYPATFKESQMITGLYGTAKK